MPFSNMPSACFKIWEAVHKEALAAGDSEEVAAKKAYGAIENAGWHKDGTSGKWVHKSDLTEFSLIIKASQDTETNTMRWKMSASDVGEDSYNDNMSIELYQDFIRRIDSSELAPEQFRSSFWKGGMPYLSISHYPDLEGKAVLGMPEATYIDGDCNKACFKSKGTFNDTPIGRAAFEAVKDNPNRPEDKKVRVSIGFLDWSHVHKSNNYKFIREDVEDICPECLKEMMKGKSAGKIYLAGQLVHLALTRVPANKRTEMEVDKSMTTRKEDAESIIGEELAEDIDKEAKLVGKSEALVIKAEDDIEVDKVALDDRGCPEGYDEEKCRKYKKEHSGGGDKPTEGDRGQDGGNTIVAKPSRGGVSPKSAATEDEPCDCNDPKNMEKDECKGKKNKSEVDLSEAITRLDEIKAMLKPKSEIVEAKPHILDAAITKLKADFDDATTVGNLSVDDRLKLLQPAFDQLGEVVKEKVSISAIPVQENRTDMPQTNQNDIVQALSEVMKPVVQQLGLMSAQLSELKKSDVVQTTQPVTPERRSFNPQLIQQKSVAVKSETPFIRALIEKTTQ
jgi:hypothetical protein